MQTFTHLQDTVPLDADVLSLLQSFAQTQQFLLTGPLTVASVDHASGHHQSIACALAESIDGSSGTPRVFTWSFGPVTAWESSASRSPNPSFGVIYVARASDAHIHTVISLHRPSDDSSASAPTDAEAPQERRAPHPIITPSFVSAFALVCRRVHHAVVAMYASQPQPGTLSPAQIDLLSLTARGLNTSQMAGELGCDAARVNSELRDALSALACSTRAQAVLKAASLGLIPLERLRCV